MLYVLLSVEKRNEILQIQIIHLSILFELITFSSQVCSVKRFMTQHKLNFRVVTKVPPVTSNLQFVYYGRTFVSGNL